MIKFKNNKVEVLPAGKKGRGVFAKKDLKKGALVEISPVIIIPEEDWIHIEETILGDYVFETEEGEVCLALGYSSIYNHSFSANASFNPHEDYIEIKATRDIERGEEVCLDYNWDAIHYFENDMVNKEEYLELLLDEEQEEE